MHSWVHRRFPWIVGGLCLSFLLLQIAYIFTQPLIMDEFEGARAVDSLIRLVPYRDYTPYKAVLGYYLELPPYLVSSGHWNGILLIKIWIALLVSAGFFGSAMMLRRHFHATAITAALLLLFCMNTFNERASELRVDMLSALFGLASLLFILERRPLWAGATASLAFFVSQKGSYFCLAGGAALLAALCLRERNRGGARTLLIYCGAGLGVAVIYLGFWSLFSSPARVFQATFLSHGSIAFDDLYPKVRNYWNQTTRRNPLFYILVVLSMYRLIRRGWKSGWPRPLPEMIGYSTVLILLCLWHRQPWPYFFVILLPTLYVLHAAMFDDLVCNEEKGRRLPLWVPLCAFGVFGIVWPLARIPHMLQRSQTYQKHMIRLADHILDPEDEYIAGVNLLFDRTQPVRQLRWLDYPSVLHLRTGIDRRELNEILLGIRNSRTKIIVQNYRLRLLPGPLKYELSRNYIPVWGSIEKYAPRVASGPFRPSVPGEYDIESSGPVVMDGREYAPGERIRLDSRAIQVDATEEFRLILVIKDISDLADPEFRKRQRMFFLPYDY